MKLKKLFKAIPDTPIKGPKDVEISGICAHSKFVAPGDLFIVRKGNVHDGHRYIAEAIATGAAAVLTDIYDPFIKDIPQIIHSDVQSIEGLVASRFYDDPSHALQVVGVTGTNGKTTCTFMLRHLLDNHSSMEEYADAKSKLFQGLDAEKAYAIVNVDDSWTERMLKHCSAKVLRYGFSDKADVRACDLDLSISGTSFTVCYEGEEQCFQWGLVGRYNISNALAVIAYGLSIGLSLSKMSEVLANFSPAPGRLESVSNDLGLAIYVDYAHTPHALENLLKGLRGLAAQRLITVFGCGGDRDREKRSVMGKIAEEFSDLCIVTSDNPRSEPPEEIINEIVSGFHDSKKARVEVDRENALEQAISLGEPGDLIVIAGKGHEKAQSFAHHTIPFDDVELAREICIQKLNNLQKSGSAVL
ncbi:hypothetical protein SCG7109_AL_00020 [Chlamydiales bacterium SCGC AG-110-M15]|nr:hypothetical protein SCG7109_AL_00020 [Chlamydiales bacterium SCGC AG-110-M15]